MASSLDLVALKVLGPGAAVLVGAAALGAGEALGLAVGPAELGGAAIALFLLREVFGFVKWFVARKDPVPAAASAVQVALPEELRAHLRENVRLLREVRDELHAQKRICVLGDVDARERFFEALERAIRRP